MSTPARKQYLDMKSKYSDAILLYQVGDFYEIFDEDAYITSRELQIVLTSRTYGDDKHVPLAGIPLHALENYVGKLVQRDIRWRFATRYVRSTRGIGWWSGSRLVF